MDKNTFILSLGGSLISTKSKIDWSYLKKFLNLILKQTKKGKKFIIITGGGATCRNYQKTAGRIAALSHEDLDWIGIHTTRFHAQFLKILFGKYAHQDIITNPTLKIKTRKKIIIGAGWKPGCSTDQDSVLIAKNQKIKTIINLSNIDYAYTRDPDKFKDAKKIHAISWTEFRKIVGNKWIPGLNMPFDPIASRTAQRIGLQVIITNGKKLANLNKIFNNQKFKGTIIS
ncbi:MAG: UMP kinase [Patescibacteria group bacterium]|nr:UMP kinase [Patescibacteria group bacterium]